MTEASSRVVDELPDEDQLRRELYEKSLLDFARGFGDERGAWGVIEGATEYVHGRHIEVICRHLEALWFDPPEAGDGDEGGDRDEDEDDRRVDERGEDMTRLIVNIPPRHMKSTLCSVIFPVWTWVRNPATQLLTTSYGQSLATRDSVKSRRLIQSDWFQKYWSDKFQLTSDQNAKERYENDETGYRVASSVGGTGTGDGGDVIVIDDPLKAGEAHSKSALKSARTWYDETLSTRANSADTRWLVIMQRLHRQDLVGHLKDQEGEAWEHLMLPAEYDPGRDCHTCLGDVDWREEEGEPLWPEKWPKEWIEKLRDRLGSYAAAAQLDQSPIPLGGGIIKEKWTRQRHSFGPEDQRRFRRVALSMDCAFEGTEDSSYVCIQAWGEFRRRQYCLLDQRRDQLDFPGTLRLVRDFVQKWDGYSMLLIERKANGHAVIQTLETELDGVLSFRPREFGSKEARLVAVSPLFEGGQVLLPEAPWVGDYVAELTDAPRSKNDDQADTTSQLLLKWTTRDDEGSDPYEDWFDDTTNIRTGGQAA